MVKLATPKESILDRLHAKKNRIQKFSGKPAEVKKPVKGLNKGFYLGACNRSACLKPGADYYNHGSLAYYCATCARELSEDAFNKRESMIEWGHNLCTPGEYDRELYDKLHKQHRETFGRILESNPGIDLSRTPTGRIASLLQQHIIKEETTS